MLHSGRRQDFSVHSSTNQHLRCLRYGFKRLAKIAAAVEAKLKQQAKRYNKDYPGQKIHADTRRLPLLEGETTQERTEYLCVAIDDYSRELFDAILADTTEMSAMAFLEQVQ